MNQDLNGIHFGVIHQCKIQQRWCDLSEPAEGSSEEDPEEFVYDDQDGYSAESDCPCHVMLVRSPYYTYARLCSPCYPNAGNLDQWDEDGFRTYCFDPSWFDDKCPYPVFRVEDDVCVYRPEKEASNGQDS
jgi:hypothetical protein